MGGSGFNIKGSMLDNIDRVQGLGLRDLSLIRLIGFRV